ncbi:MAG: thiamine pyrophosphate-dependent enzyme, partial [Armatimonadota bacterium]
GINGVIEAMRKRRDSLGFIVTRHEEAAAFAAVGYAKFSGKMGVCLATTGPGAIHLLNGLYDAKMDQQPVLALTGMPYHDLIGTVYQQDVDTAKVFSDATIFSERIMGPMHVVTMVDQAVRLALSRPGPAHLAFPNDFQDQTVDEDSPSSMNQPGGSKKGVHTSPVFTVPKVVPTPDDLHHAARVLNEGKKVVMLIGSGSRDARAEVEQVSDLLGAPIAKALLGKDALPDDHPNTTQTIGVYGTSATHQAMQGCDTLLLVGTSFPWISYLPDPEKVRAVQIERNAERLGLRFPVEAGLLGDARETLRALIPLLERKSDRTYLQSIQKTMGEWKETMARRADSQDLPMRPQVFASEVGKQLADDAIVTVDSGTNTLYAARCIPMRGTQRWSCSGLLASMGCGLPYAIAAQAAHPDRQVVAFVGDGGLTMSLGDLATLRKYNLPVKLFVMKNNVLGQIRWEQMMFLGNPEYGVELENIEFAKMAEGFGIRGFKVENPGDVARIVAEALAHDGPVLVEGVTDPFEPLMPGHIKPEQAEKLAESLTRGQPNADRIGITLYRDALEELSENQDLILKALQEHAPELVPAGVLKRDESPDASLQAQAEGAPER